MRYIKHLSVSFLLALLVAASLNTVAADNGDVGDFVESASSAGVAEIELGKLALKETKSAEVKTFAQHMIDDHTKANNELKQIAENKKVDFEQDATLLAKAKEEILKMRDGLSFDLAYASNQVRAHTIAIDLFERATHSEDAQISAYAKKYLPTLQKHLVEARELVQTTERALHEAGVDTGSGVGAGSVPPTTYR